MLYFNKEVFLSLNKKSFAEFLAPIVLRCRTATLNFATRHRKLQKLARKWAIVS